MAPHIAAEHPKARSGLIAALYFSVGRLIAYLTLGLIVGYFGVAFFNPNAAAIVVIPLGIILVIYGFLISFGTKMKYASVICCGFRRVKSTFLLGLVMGLWPCIPLIAALTYSVTLSSTLQSLVFMISFWLGSTTYMPILGILTGTLTHYAVVHSNAERIRRISGIALVVVGFIFVSRGLAYAMSTGVVRV